MTQKNHLNFLILTVIGNLILNVKKCHKFMVNNLFIVVVSQAAVFLCAFMP